MPYKDPERKRQWECDHREQRNARRRKVVFQEANNDPQNRAPDPCFQVGNLWTIAAGVAVVLMVIAIAFIATRPAPGSRSDSQAEDAGR